MFPFYFKLAESIKYNLDLDSLKAIGQWRKRENLFRAMCDGLFNYFWTNNWLGGFLYLFQFRAKLKPDDGAANGYTVNHCEKIIYLDI